jgi:transposase
MLTNGEVFFHDNTLPHTAARAEALLEHFNWQLFDYPLHSPELPPSEYNLFTYLKNRIRSQRCNCNKELVGGVKTWLSSQAANFYDAGIQKSIPRYDKCLNSGDNYVET